jgi:hypothetical protein
MAVKEPPLVWRTCDEEKVTLSEGGAVATKLDGEEYEEYEDSLVTSGTQLTAGKHYWEVVILNDPSGSTFVGVTRPNLNPTDDHSESTDGWFILPDDGGLWGNGKQGADAAGRIDEGGRVGVLLNLDEGSLRFFKNGVQHGPGYPAGSVTGPVVCAVQMYIIGTCVRLLPQDMGHALLK